MRYLAFTLMLLSAVFTGCQPKVKGEGPWVQKIDSEEVSRIVINFSTQMKIDKHLELEDSWVSYDDYIKKINLIYSSQRLLTVYDARLLLVELVEDFLYRLNNNMIVSFELDHFPFKAEDLDVKIIFESYYGQYVDELYVGSVRLRDGCVWFYAFDNTDKSEIGIDWNHHRSEPYSKSRELALIKRKADMPFIDSVEHPSRKVRESNQERYFYPNI